MTRSATTQFHAADMRRCRGKRVLEISCGLGYDGGDGDTQCHYVTATASNDAPAQLPIGTLHDSAIVSSLNKRIRDLEAKLADLQKAEMT